VGGSRETGRGEAPPTVVGGGAAARIAIEERRIYYVKAATRGADPGRRGTPRQAVAYITGSHDERRDPEMSTEELDYVARMDPEWTVREAVVHITKTSRGAPGGAGDALAYVGRHEPGRKMDLERGRVPLVGFGVLAGLSGDDETLVARFEWECVPYDRRATAGYKSFTLTVPKEVSLYAEGHRAPAKEALYEAVAATVEDTFVGLDVSAVGAVHTRNEAGEVHFHVHLLVAKFARNRANGRHVSVNSKAGGNTGRRIWDLKRAWKGHLDRVLKERLEVQVEQEARHGSVAIRLRDGTRLGRWRGETSTSPTSRWSCGGRWHSVR
jgi:hypothetical protein